MIPVVNVVYGTWLHDFFLATMFVAAVCALFFLFEWVLRKDK